MSSVQLASTYARLSLGVQGEVSTVTSSLPIVLMGVVEAHVLFGHFLEGECFGSLLGWVGEFFCVLGAYSFCGRYYYVWQTGVVEEGCGTVTLLFG